MSKLIQILLEQIVAGKIDKKVGTEILKALKNDKKIRKDIAIIGLSLRLPFADNPHEFWNHIRNGDDCIGEYPMERRKDSEQLLPYFTDQISQKVKYKVGGYLERIDKFDYDFFGIPYSDARLMDPNQRIFLEVALGAIEDAGYGGKNMVGSKTGLYVGYNYWPFYGHYISRAEPKSLPQSIPGNVASITASRLSYLLDLKGPSMLIDTACSSSLVAVHTACQGLHSGDCELAIAGGIYIDLLPIEGLMGIGIESSSNKTKAFDDASDGTVWGEGVAAILLKPLENALKDKDSIYAVIKGSAINSDGSSASITAPNVVAQKEVLQSAWKDAKVDPTTITYLEAHGTGTKLGDPIEIEGICKAFREYTDKKQFCALSSVKTNVGHTNSSAGIISLIKTALALKYGEIPPSLHFKKPNRNIDFINSPLYVNTELTKWKTENKVRRCGVSSFGFSGTNCHVILEERSNDYEENKETIIKGLHIFTLSAKSKEALKKLIMKYKRFIKMEPKLRIEDICYSANIGRGDYNYRVAMIVKDDEDFRHKILSLDLDNLKDSSSNYLVFYQYAKVVNKKRMTGQKGEITPDQARVLTQQININIESLINDSYNNVTSLINICKLYVQGIDIEWDKYYQGKSCNRVNLPVYAFDQHRCWVDAPIKNNKKPEETSEVSVTKSEEWTIILKGRTDDDYTVTERLIGKIWGRVLGVHDVHIDDNFFELGGHSILATKLEVDLNELGLVVSSTDIYERPTLREFSEHFNDVKHEKKSHYIENIEPFNDIFYQNCIMNAFFAVMNHYNRDIMPFIMNDMMFYKYDKAAGDDMLQIDYVQIQQIDELIQCAGIGMDTKWHTKQLTAHIIESLNQNRPVVLWIDCYYSPIREDMYLKEHWPHTLLIYGYDANEQIFHIIEHKHKDNLFYQKREISYHDLNNCYNGYESNFNKEKDKISYYSFYEVQTVKNKNLNEKQNIFIHSVYQNASDFEQSLRNLESFLPSYKLLVLDNDLLKNHSQQLLKMCIDISNAKNVERYRMLKLFGDKIGETELMDEILHCWNKLRKTIAIYNYSSRYKYDAMMTSVDIFKKVIELEKQFILKLCKLRSDNSGSY